MATNERRTISERQATVLEIVHRLADSAAAEAFDGQATELVELQKFGAEALPKWLRWRSNVFGGEMLSVMEAVVTRAWEAGILELVDENVEREDWEQLALPRRHQWDAQEWSESIRSRYDWHRLSSKTMRTIGALAPPVYSRLATLMEAPTAKKWRSGNLSIELITNRQAWSKLPREGRAAAVKKYALPEPSAEEVARLLGMDRRSWRVRMEALAEDAVDLKELGGVLAKALAAGKKYDELVNLVLPFVEGGESAARRIARDQMLGLSNRLLERQWDMLGSAIEGAEIHATFQNTRPEHAARHGTRYYKANGTYADRPRLPDAVNCQCYYTPIVRGGR